MYPDNSVYEGSFRNNLKDGKGIFKFADGSSYTGDWKDDLKHGRGAFTWADGMKFVGDFQLGESKAGQLTTKDGHTRDIAGDDAQ